MQRNKFLDNIGLDITSYGVNFSSEGDARQEKWDNQRVLYGFDSRECWDLYVTLIEWLYSHLMMYKEDASHVIDLSRHELTYKYNKYSLAELIDMMIDDFKEFLTVRLNDWKREEESIERCNEAFEILSICWRYLWW